MTQVAALLKSNKPEKASIEFTQSDLQVLKVLLESVLSVFEDNKAFLKKEIQNMWSGAEKGAMMGEYCFSELNRLRDIQRLNKQRSNRVAKIQQKVKKQLSK